MGWDERLSFNASDPPADGLVLMVRELSSRRAKVVEVRRLAGGVDESHTHTEAYPSPTDVAQAPDPVWHYVILSLKREAPVLRSYRIVDGR